MPAPPLIPPLSRQARRAQSRQTARTASAAVPPLPGDPPSADELARQTARFGQVLGKATRERLRAAVDALHRQYEQTVAAHPPRQAVACGKGCAFCCHTYVSATAPELFAIAEHVGRWPEPRRAALIARLVEADAVTRGLSAVDRVRLSRPCPMLEDGACAIYPARPLGCRAYASFDVGPCERSLVERDPQAPIPVPRVNMRTRRFLAHTFRAALAERGLDGNAYELNAGLVRALSVPDAETRWRAGEDVFADIQHDATSGTSTSSPPPSP